MGASELEVTRHTSHVTRHTMGASELKAVPDRGGDRLKSGREHGAVEAPEGV